MPSLSMLSLSEKIKRQLDQQNSAALKRLLKRHNFADIAEVLENDLTETELAKCFEFVEVGQASQILTSLSEDKQIACLSLLPVTLTGEILRHMPSDDAVDILQELEPQQIQKILETMPYDTETRSLHHLMMAEPDKAAGIMSTDFIETSVEKTIGEALEMVKQAEEKDFIYYIYLTDTAQKLVGVISLKGLILHEPDLPLHQVAHFDMKTIGIDDDQEAVANEFRKYYNLLAMPVVDEDGMLRGIITLDDIVDVIDEETSEDIYLASGINLEAIDEKNLLTGPMINAFKARIPWLLVTLCGQCLAVIIISKFHHTMETAVAAISFMPLLSGLSGNMGAQSETITVRGLAQNLVNPENFWEKVGRELRLGLLTGLCFGVAVAIYSFVLYQHWELSGLLFLAIILSLCSSTFLGMSIPFVFQHIFKQDPAGVGGPMLTTLLDILTFTGYLYILTVFLERMTF